MGADDRTDRFRPVFEPEEIFDRFVRNANASTEFRPPRDDEPTGVVQAGAHAPAPKERRPTGLPTWDHQITVRAAAPLVDLVDVIDVDEAEPQRDEEGTKPDAPMPIAMARAFAPADDEYDDDDSEEDLTTVRKGGPLTESGQRIVLLTKVKQPSRPPPPPAPPAKREPEPWESVVTPRGQHTQKLEALRLVPDVGAVAPKLEKPVRESGEDGQIPTRQLDQILSDMSVLLRYGHAGQVRERLEQLRRTYPEDLLLLRRIAEFHVEHGDTEAALETLFALAGGLFERRNVEGMRQALEQVLVLDPDNGRAYRLLGLLEQR